MNITYDESTILQEIQRLVTTMTSDNITHENICDYNKSKHIIISNSRNIFFLLNVLKNEHDLSNQVVLEILNIIYSIITTYENSLNVEFILTELLQCQIEDLALINAMGKSVAFISEILFVSENKFVLPIDETRDSISPLEAFVFENFLDYFSAYSKEDVDVIQEEIIPLFIKCGIKLLFNQPTNGATILRASLIFGINPSKSFYNKNIKWALNCFCPPEIFQCLAEITTAGSINESLDALTIVTILSKSLVDRTPSSSQIIENIQQFILAILQDESILEDQTRAFVIRTLLTNINPESKYHPFDEVIDFLYKFCQTILKNTPLLLTIIYPGILSFFKSFKGNNSREGFYQEFIDGMRDCFIQYVDLLLNSFDVNTDQTVEQIFEIKGSTSISYFNMFSTVFQIIEQIFAQFQDISKLLSLLLEFSDLTIVHEYIKNKTLEIINDEITVINSFKISFILIALNCCYSEFEKFLPENQAVLFDLLFDLLPLMQSILPQYSQLSSTSESPFYIAIFFLLNISTLLHKNFININQSKVFNEFNQLCSNSDVVVIISSILSFLLFMIENNIETRLASFVLKDILKTQTLCEQLVNETDFPNYFLENYTLLPCKAIYYFALIKLVFENPLKRSDFFINLTQYLSQLISSQSNQTEPEQIDQSESFNRFFKIISTFFDSSFETGESFEFFEYVLTHFGDLIEKVSDSEYSRYVLKFITKLTETKDGKKRLPENLDKYPKTSPYTFQIFRFFCILLTNILKNTDLNQLSVDESVFLSSIPTSDIYLDALQISTGIEDGDWESLSLNIKSMNYFLVSPFPNFAIMQYYDDTCLIEYFDVLINQVTRTTLLSLLSIPYVFDQLLIFIRLFAKSYDQTILETESFLNFILDVTKVAFLSNNPLTLSNSCLALAIINRGIKMLEDKSPFQGMFNQHYILALNLLTIPEIDDDFGISPESDSNEFELKSDRNIVNVKEYAYLFIYWFMCNDIEFPSNVIDQILAGVTAENAKKSIGEALDSLINDAYFDGKEEDKKRFLESIKYFCITSSQNSFRLDYLQSMSDFFVFK